MTPDKVYLQEGFSVSVVGFVSPAWDNPKDKENIVEYVRKEALLRWLNDYMKGLSGGCVGQRFALLKMIDKLNNM